MELRAQEIRFHLSNLNHLRFAIPTRPLLHHKKLINPTNTLLYFHHLGYEFIIEDYILWFLGVSLYDQGGFAFWGDLTESEEIVVDFYVLEMGF